MNINNSDNFWLDEPSILYNNNNFLYFIPTTNMTNKERLNAITRFCIYTVLLTSIFNKNIIWIQLAIIIIVLVILISKFINPNENFDANNSKYKYRKPNVNNPFMNPTLNDTMVYNSPLPMNVDDEDIIDQVDENFNKDLYRDVGDVFEKKNSQRQFYTVPQSNPPNTVQFAQWLYGNTPSCKSSQSACYKNNDLRFRGYIY
jgi:hypothetical protein